LVTFLLREDCPSANLRAPYFRARPFLISRPPNRLGVSARDSLRLTRREQVKSMAVHVLTFTQHTQLFHRRQNCRSEGKSSRNPMHPLRKNLRPLRQACPNPGKRQKNSPRTLWKNRPVTKYILPVGFCSCSPQRTVLRNFAPVIAYADGRIFSTFSPAYPGDRIRKHRADRRR
jgi:hypothetical protein